MRSLFAETVKFNAYALFPHVRKSKDNTQTDKGFQIVLYGLKDGNSFTSEGKSHDPAEWIAGHASEWEELKKAAKGCDLVPIPKSEPTGAVTYWPGRDFAEALVKAGIGAAVNPCIERVTEVPKSNKAKSKDDRNTVDVHMKSMRVISVPTRPVLLVDDTLTLGSTGMACHQILRAAGHKKPIELLAAFHTRFQNDEARTHGTFLIDWFPGTPHADKTMVSSRGA